MDYNTRYRDASRYLRFTHHSKYCDQLLRIRYAPFVQFHLKREGLLHPTTVQTNSQHPPIIIVSRRSNAAIDSLQIAEQDALMRQAPMISNK